MPSSGLIHGPEEFGPFIGCMCQMLTVRLGLVVVPQARCCGKPDKPQPIWDAVIETKPEHFVFLGDDIYADTGDMDVMKAKYAPLGKQPGYIKLKAR